MNAGRILLLGGTGDARLLRAYLQGYPEFQVTYSLAGRTKEPDVPEGEVRIGGFGGVEGLVRYLHEAAITAVIDATHPYAVQMTANAVRACAQTKIPLIGLVREAWEPQAADCWMTVPSAAEACRVARDLGQRIFVTLGRQELAAFADCHDRWFLIRSIEAPPHPLPQHHEVVLERGPFTLAKECALLQKAKIEVLISKNSGGSATYPKIEAARMLSLPVVMIERPPRPNIPIAHTCADVIRWLQV